MSAATNERMLTPDEVAEHCALSTKAVRRAIERGELPASKLCSRIRVRMSDVETWIAARQVQPRRVDFTVRPVAMPAKNGLRALLADGSRARG